MRCQHTQKQNRSEARRHGQPRRGTVFKQRAGHQRPRDGGQGINVLTENVRDVV